MGETENHLFTLSHVCRQPTELVWQAWTGEEHLQNWFGPKGMRITPMQMESRPEGEFRYRLTAEDGSEMWGKWIFIELIPLERLVMVIAFTDENGEITRYPPLKECPLETFVVVEFREQGNKTLITLEATPYLANDTEIAAFDSSHIDMTQQWRNCFDRLDSYLEQRQ